jgi:hypothetical protein
VGSTAELKELSRFLTYDQFIKSLARAEGEIFTDDFGDGPRMKRDTSSAEASLTRRFDLSSGMELLYGQRDCNQLSSDSVPRRPRPSPGRNRTDGSDLYQNRKDKFIQLVARTYLVENEASLQERLILAEASELTDKTSPSWG